jgi:hypothetical protein
VYGRREEGRKKKKKREKNIHKQNKNVFRRFISQCILLSVLHRWLTAFKLIGLFTIMICSSRLSSISLA